MASLIATQLEAAALLREHGLAQQGWTFEFDRARNRAGSCRYTRYTITMSRYLVQLWEPADVTQTLLHEVAHALAWMRHGERGHGPTWMRIAESIGFTRGTRTHSNATVPGRYLAKCPTHGDAGRMHRLSETRRKYSICAKCRQPVTWVDTGAVKV